MGQRRLGDGPLEFNIPPLNDRQEIGPKGVNRLVGALDEFVGDASRGSVRGRMLAQLSRVGDRIVALLEQQREVARCITIQVSLGVEASVSKRHSLPVLVHGGSGYSLKREVQCGGRAGKWRRFDAEKITNDVVRDLVVLGPANSMQEVFTQEKSSIQ